jgi:hypothetical protein
MKKLLYFFLILTAHTSYSQYFGEKITYLKDYQNENRPPPYEYYSVFYHLELTDQDSIQENYRYWRDTVNGFYPFSNQYDVRSVTVRNDSIFVDDELTFITNLAQGDSFSLPMETDETVLYVDSVFLTNGLKHTQFSIDKTFNSTGDYGDFLWVEGVGSYFFGLELLELGLFFDQQQWYRAYCKNGIPKNMDGSDWTETQDDCGFEAYIAERKRKTALDNEKLKLVKIYPNPVKDYLMVDGISSGTYLIRTLTGQIVASGTWQNTVDVSNLSRGLYFVEIAESQQFYRLRFLK